MSNIADASCPKCKALIFPSLPRKPSIRSINTKKLVNADSTPQSASLSNQSIQNKLICGIIGVGAKQNIPSTETPPSQKIIRYPSKSSKRLTRRLHERNIRKDTFQIETHGLQVVGASNIKNLRNEVETLAAKRNHKSSSNIQNCHKVDESKRASSYNNSLPRNSDARDFKKKIGFEFHRLNLKGSSGGLHRTGDID